MSSSSPVPVSSVALPHTDYEAVARAQPQELSQAIQHGIPPVIRGSMWQLSQSPRPPASPVEAVLILVSPAVSSSKDPELEALYSSLLHQTSPHEKAIQKDLARTFPSHKFFQRPKGAQPSGSGSDTAEDRGRGQDDLFNVVRAYSLYDPEVGYVQGSAFIVAALLLNVSAQINAHKQSAGRTPADRACISCSV